ncbi:hypothetical protein [Klebsiella variicola]|uniref:hypothetical protein n=1 Tax=Klebsiella variicola TaxID=244366 RepID=UPI001FA74BD8|nr:hypothetical protein [Klebsiella variicola]MCI4451865.1 hypothetical protein [Klebsiella variicola]MDD9254856.1 hypothetical protein [Klebsiella variicola]
MSTNSAKDNVITTPKELGKAIKEDRDTITIEGSLAKTTVKIHATGKVAWAIAFAAIGIAVVAAMATLATGGTSAPTTGTTAALSAGGAAAILGSSATSAAIYIAIAAGGVGALTKLRRYKVVEKSDSRLVLKKG